MHQTFKFKKKCFISKSIHVPILGSRCAMYWYNRFT